jgi:hypothetical protein
MAVTLSEFNQTIFSNNGDLLNSGVNTALFEIAKSAPQNFHSLCYEKPLNEQNSIDFLASYQTSQINLDALKTLFEQADDTEYSQRLIDFINIIPTSQYHWPISALWLSFDWQNQGYATLPTFYYSTQHNKFRDVDFIGRNIMASCEILAPEYLHHARKIIDTPYCKHIMHLGFTYGRAAFRLKVTAKLAPVDLLDWLTLLEWPGDFDVLSKVLETFADILIEPQVSLSFAAKMINKIEIEFPWIGGEKQDHITPVFMDKLMAITFVDATKIQSLHQWYKRDANAALYLKISLCEEGSLTVKAYLHTLKNNNSLLNVLRRDKND